MSRMHSLLCKTWVCFFRFLFPLFFAHLFLSFDNTHTVKRIGPMECVLHRGVEIKVVREV